MTKQELISNIKIKMDSDPSTQGTDYYENYYEPLINECLSVIANTALPYQKKMEVNWGGYYEDGVELNEKLYNYYTVGQECIINGKEAKRKDWLKYEDGKWSVQKKNNYGFLATIPNDFLSFSDEAATEYRNAYDELTLGVDVLYVNSKTLALSKDGNYTIYYNAEYPDISSNIADENLDFIPTNVLKLIPIYVAGQLLMGEDPIKATQLKNEFETMLARLDTNKPLVSYRINNSDGWVL